MTWYRRAATQRHPEAMCAVARWMLISNEGGRPPSDDIYVDPDSVPLCALS